MTRSYKSRHKAALPGRMPSRTVTGSSWLGRHCQILLNVQCCLQIFPVHHRLQRCNAESANCELDHKGTSYLQGATGPTSATCQKEFNLITCAGSCACGLPPPPPGPPIAAAPGCGYNTSLFSQQSMPAPAAPAVMLALIIKTHVLLRSA